MDLKNHQSQKIYDKSEIEISGNFMYTRCQM